MCVDQIIFGYLKITKCVKRMNMLLIFTEPDDYIGGVQTQRIPSGQTRTCAEYSIQQDNLVEGNEQFSVKISNLLPTDVSGLAFGQQTTTTITIIDASKYIMKHHPCDF